MVANRVVCRLETADGPVVFLPRHFFGFALMTASPVVAPSPVFPTDPRMAVFQNSAPSHPNPRLAGVEAASPRPESSPAPAATPRRIDDATRCELHRRLIGSLDLSTVGTRSETELRAEIRLAA
ncbi:MAG TPA: hypothetical protein DC058_01050, partial [Planctomycetaceae bacterium]|nr:hypothetical protein [Planctomycetaceae bacterium]